MAETVSRKLTNLTPHDVRVHLDNGTVIVYPASGRIARAIPEPQEAVDDVYTRADNVPCVAPPKYVRVEGMHPEDNNVIVSQILAESGLLANITVFVPDNGPGSAVRGSDGRVVGVKRLIKYEL